MDDWKINDYSCTLTKVNVEGRNPSEGYSNGVLRRPGLPDKNCSFVPVKSTELLPISSNMERLVGSDSVLSIYGLLSHRTENRYLFVTDRIDSSLDQSFKNEGDPYNESGYLKPSLADKVRGLLASFVVLCKNNVKHCDGCDIKATQIFVVKGKVKLLYVTIHSPHENEEHFSRYSGEQLNRLFSHLLNPQNKILVKKEYTHFCGLDNYLKEKAARHPLLLSPWERLALPAHVHCRLLSDGKYYPNLLNRKCRMASWQKNISPNSITGVILAHRSYGHTAHDCLDFLRNFVEHVFERGTLDKYCDAIGDKNATLPSLVEMNQLLASQIGEDYLLNIFKNIDSRHWK